MPAVRRRLFTLCSALSLVCVSLFGTGCSPGQLFAPLMGDVPHVSGTWRGILQSVTVTDNAGCQYEAAALQISEGPRLPYKSGMHPSTDGVAGRRLALLSKSWDRPLRILEAKDAGVPLRAVVKVRGRMQIDSLSTPPSTERNAGGVTRSLREAEHPLGPVILMKGRPKVITTFEEMNQPPS